MGVASDTAAPDVLLPRMIAVNSTLFLFGLIGAGMLLLGVIIGLAAKGRARAQYVRADALMSPPELRFFATLREAVGDRAVVMGKVRIADLLNVHPRLQGKARLVALNRIAAKHCDFALMNPADGIVLCAVELDDASHNRADVMRRDALVNTAFQEAGVPLHRVKLKEVPDADLLRARLFASPEPVAGRREPTADVSGLAPLPESPRRRPAIH